MTWQTGAMLTLGALVAIYVLLAVLTPSPPDETDWREFNRDQAKRRIAERGKRTRMGLK